MGATIRNCQSKKNVVTDWSGLHQDFNSCFAEQIVSMKDFFAFGGVCKSWRSEAIKENSNAALRLQHKVPILLPPKEYNDPIRNIYSLTKGHIYQLDLPETKSKICFSSLGWLLTISWDCSNPHLFNPLTHAHIELPLISSRYWEGNVRKLVLSSNPSWTSNYEVLLMSSHCLAYYRPGYNNGRWNVPLLELVVLLDAVYYKGQFYALDFRGKLFVCEMEDPNNTHLRLVAEVPLEILLGPEIHLNKAYLVESATGTLLLVLSLFDEDYDTTIAWRVFEVPFDDGKSWAKSEVKNLGNTTLFVGANYSSFSIEPLDNSVCKANCIYFLNRSHVSTRDHIDMGIYYMDEGKIENHLETLLNFHYKGKNLTSHSWIQPSF
ncbi:F-box protein At4g00893-like [Argentina anserina]|uniref:F-box protein At4g00893-like n=1 Tax=Argentina anserina TaxID=57926 RepID=UPI0021762605|nr:F-box protein At4g00893-like [Potentilla anserina]